MKIILYLVILCSFFSVKAQTPQITKEDEKNAVLQSFLEFETTSAGIVISDFKKVTLESEVSNSIERHITIKVLDVLSVDFNEVFIDFFENEIDRFSISCIVRKASKSSVGSPTITKSVVLNPNGKISIDVLKEELGNGDVFTISYNFTASGKEKIKWKGWESMPIQNSEFYFEHPKFYSSSLVSDLKPTAHEVVSKELKYRTDTLLNLIIRLDEKGFRNTEKSMFLSNYWSIKNLDGEKVIGKVSTEFNKEEFQEFIKVSLKDVEYLNLYEDYETPSFIEGKNFSGYYYYDEGYNDLFLGTYERKIKIRVLTQSGTNLGDFQTLAVRNNYLSRKDNLGKTKKSIKVTVFNKEEDGLKRYDISEDAIFEIESGGGAYYRFAAPNVKEGSIIFVSYVTYGYGLYDWTFQRQIPSVKSKFSMTLPARLEVSKRIVGDLNIDFSESATNKLLKQEFVAENVNPYHEEPLVSSLENYISSVNFSLERTQYNNMWEDWEKATSVLNEMEKFGKFLLSNKESRNLVKSVKALTKTEKELADSLYSYMTNNHTWNGRLGILASEFKGDFLNEKNGNVGSINLTLTSLLREAGINANPIVMKTRSSGIMDISSPRLNELNYVVCGAEIEGQIMILDATDKYRSLGMLPERALNSLGVMIREDSHEVIVLPESEERKRTTYINAEIDTAGILTGVAQRSHAKYAAYELKSEIDSTSISLYRKKLVESFLLFDVSEHDIKLDYYSNKSVRESFKIKANLGALSNSEIQITPVFIPFLSTNPLTLEEREFPVSIAITDDFTYILNLAIPDNYVISSIPKSEIFHMSENGKNGSIRVIYGGNENLIQLTFQVSLDKSYYLVEEYELIKSFYNKAVQLSNSRIVLTKI